MTPNMKTPTVEEINANLKKFASRKLIKNRYPEFYEYLLETYPFIGKITEGMYLYFHGMSEPPKCPICGKPVKFITWTDGYKQFCSQKCMSRGTRDKAVQSCIERHGGVGFASETIGEKIMNSIKDKYGENWQYNEEIREKTRNTNMERYGVASPMQNDEIKERVENTMMERYGVKHALQCEEFLNKSRETLKSHYGVINPSQSPEIMDKIRKIQTEKYGGVFAGSEQIKQAIMKSNIEKYGVPFPIGTKEVREKVKQTVLERYGVDNVFKSPVIKEKIKETNMIKYGRENPMVGSCKYNYSPISQKCFIDLDRYLKDYTTMFATKPCGEMKFEIKGTVYYVDYFIKELDVAIEFYGDLWHANPEKYGPEDRCNPFNPGITASEIWEIDKRRIEALKSIGVDTVVIWESDFKNKNWSTLKFLRENIDPNI